MKLTALLLLGCFCLLGLDCSLPPLTPAPPLLQTEAPVTSDPNADGSDVARLPGLCRRLKRRRITVLCNMEKFCWRGRSQGRGPRSSAGQVCRCPRGSACLHFFIHSL